MGYIVVFGVNEIQPLSSRSQENNNSGIVELKVIHMTARQKVSCRALSRRIVDAFSRTNMHEDIRSRISKEIAYTHIYLRCFERKMRVSERARAHAQVQQRSFEINPVRDSLSFSLWLLLHNAYICITLHRCIATCTPPTHTSIDFYKITHIFNV